MATSADLDSVLAKLHKVRKVGSGWQALCPAHDDHDPSLSIAFKNGKVLLHCHTGCSQEAVWDKLGFAGAHYTEVAHYDYVDEQGKLCFQCIRKEHPYKKKIFTQR